MPPFGQSLLTWGFLVTLRRMSPETLVGVSFASDPSGVSTQACAGTHHNVFRPGAMESPKAWRVGIPHKRQQRRGASPPRLACQFLRHSCTNLPTALCSSNGIPINTIRGRPTLRGSPPPPPTPRARLRVVQSGRGSPVLPAVSAAVGRVLPCDTWVLAGGVAVLAGGTLGVPGRFGRALSHTHTHTHTLTPISFGHIVSVDVLSLLGYAAVLWSVLLPPILELRAPLAAGQGGGLLVVWAADSGVHQVPPQRVCVRPGR